MTQVSGTFPELAMKMAKKPKKPMMRGPKLAALKKLGPMASKALKGGGC